MVLSFLVFNHSVRNIMEIDLRINLFVMLWIMYGLRLSNFGLEITGQE